MITRKGLIKKCEASVFENARKKEITAIFAVPAPQPESKNARIAESESAYGNIDDLDKRIQQLETDMRAAAQNLEFEQAAKLRDHIQELKKRFLLAN